MTAKTRTLVAVAALVALVAVPAWAHQMTFKGTVAGIEPKRIQVKTGEEPKGTTPAWYPIDAKTKIVRGKTALSYADAKIAVGERVVVDVDHEADGTMRTIDILLAAK